MAISKIKKYQILTTKDQKDFFLEILQESSAAQIQEFKTEETKNTPYNNLAELEKIELEHANLDFAIKFIQPYAKKRGLFEGPITVSSEEMAERVKDFNHHEIIKQIIELEDQRTKAVNTITTLKNAKQIYAPWKKLTIKLSDLTATHTSKTLIGTVKTPLFSELSNKVNKLSNLTSIQKIDENPTETYFFIISEKELAPELEKLLSEYKFTEASLPEEKLLMEDYLENLNEEIKSNEQKIAEIEKESKKLAIHNEDFQIAYDFINWKKEKLETEKRLSSTSYSVIINAWIPEESLAKIEEQFSKNTNKYAIFELELEENEEPPVIIKNSNFITPFEAVTNIYGLPKHHELDPTPYLSFFFILFFALCLTDAGYGIVMAVTMGLVLKFMKLAPGIKKLVKLLMYGGVATFIIGALFGGWFGLEAAKMPESLKWLTYTTESGEVMFFMQKINALTNPITVLIIALSLGFFQLVLGVYMALFHNFRHGNKKDAILDHGTWAFMLTGIGLFILGAAGVLPPPFAAIAKWWVILAAITLVLTQGREKTSIIGKAFSGILSLYGLVGYMSDVLSYSRLLALGLATAIIGLAINTIVGLAMGLPYINYILVPLIFIGGHIFNLLINALGAFIHSGRLQFVEFFGKFMEGGGDEFKPFSKKNKYVYIKND